MTSPLTARQAGIASIIAAGLMLSVRCRSSSSR